MVRIMQQTLSVRRDKSGSAKHDTIVDPDELQIMDECNREWVDSWKKAGKK